MAGTLAWYDVFYNGINVVFNGIPVGLRAPQESQNREGAYALELDIDTCLNVFGHLPCTATGKRCYNTFATCNDKVNFVRGTKTYKFCSRGMAAPVGELIRPYIDGMPSAAPTEIKPGDGLAVRSQITVSLVDEVDSDSEADPYVALRQTPAGGTFWRRFQARNPNAVSRFARLRKGYINDPFTWGDFDTQLFIIDAVRGPDTRGSIQVVLSDVLRLADKATLPIATDGKAQVAMPNIVFTGAVVSATATTVTLPASASPILNAYTGMEIYISSGIGTGQRKVITAYSGLTRTATVATWLVQPVSGSTFDISSLSINVGTGKGVQYGTSGYMRINDEVIRFSAVIGDVLSWPDSSYRAQFGTVRADHDQNAGVQLCTVFSDAQPDNVIRTLLNAAGITDAYVDLAGLQVEREEWMSAALVTVCLTEPNKISEQLKAFTKDVNLMLWWDGIAQKVKGKVNVPQIQSTVIALTDDDFIAGSTTINRQDDLRITDAAQYYELLTATSNKQENKNYQRAEIRIDADARSDNEYGDVRSDVAQSIWLSEANQSHVQALVARRVAYLRDAPYKVRVKLDPRSRVALGDLYDLTTRRLTDADGNAVLIRSRLVKLDETTADRDCEFITTTFAGKRWGFIGPNTAPDFGSASDADKQYAYVSDNTGKMGDGTEGYLIV